MDNMFEEATKRKVRFDVGSSGQQYSVEDLWDMPLTTRSKVSLDGLAKALNRQIKESEEESFVVQQSSANATLQLKFDIVKHVIGVRLAEKEAKDNAAKEKAQKQKILEIIAKKEDESLENKSIEELRALVSS